jgi:hypothetical protein
MMAEKLILISILNVILHTISKTKKDDIKKVTREMISLFRNMWIALKKREHNSSSTRLSSNLDIDLGSYLSGGMKKIGENIKWKSNKI